MGKRYSLVEAGTSEPLSFYELGEDLFIRYVEIRIRQQLAENLDTVLFATCVHVAKDTAGADKLFQYHER